MAATTTRTKIGVCVLGFLGIVLLIIGVVTLSVLPSVFRAKLEENLVLAEGKEVFEKWKDVPVPIFFNIYIFNITNPIDVQNGSKPILEEVGPYVFRQKRRKEIVGWDKENLTVTYNDIKTYFFEPEKSRSQNEKVYFLNMPLIGMAKFANKLSFFMRGIVVPALNNLLETYGESLFVHRPVRELLFEGYKVNVIEDVINLAKPFKKVPQLLPNNTFGLFYGRNNTGEGMFTVYTGEDDIAKFTQVVAWNNMNHIPWWKDKYCNMLNGTDGAQFPPPISRQDILYVYTPEICRSVYLEYQKDVMVEGILAYRFITPERLLASAVDNGDNKCFCSKEFCNSSGILVVTDCKKGIPIAITGPHFYEGHDYYRYDVHGMQPLPERHQTFVDIEPTTGVVLRATRKFQMNFLLDKQPGFKQTEKLRKTVLPLLWIEEGAEIDSKTAEQFTAKVKTPVTIAKSVLTASIVLGILWILTAGAVTLYILLKQSKTRKKPVKNVYKPVALSSTEKDGEKEEKYKTVNT